MKTLTLKIFGIFVPHFELINPNYKTVIVLLLFTIKIFYVVVIEYYYLYDKTYNLFNLYP